MDTRIIGHLDMDAFFASVEERERAWLKGSPLVIGADPEGGEGRGVVATANYKARAYGIQSALPIRLAWEYSERARREGKPGVVFLSPRFSHYSSASEEVFGIVRQFFPHVEQTSVDEGYIDFTSARSFRRARVCAQRMKRAIKEKTKLTCSIGIGPNRMVAKIASGFCKPDGLMVVLPSKAESFLASLPIRSIPGVGPRGAHKLHVLGVFTVGELRNLTWQKLARVFGSYGLVLYERARGVASSRVSSEGAEVKSIGKHETFRTDTLRFDFVVKEMSALSARIMKRMRRLGFKGARTAVLTVRFDDFETKQRSLSTRDLLATPEMLERRALKLLMPFFEKQENPKRKSIRMIGLRIEKLV